MMSDTCCICTEDESFADNPIVYCEGAHCSVIVHKTCYGISEIPLGEWLCEVCEFKRNVKVYQNDTYSLIDCNKKKIFQCELCPSNEGALKKTNKNLWTHVVCALFIRECYFGNNETMTPIILDKIPQEKFSKVCYICVDSGNKCESVIGATIKCSKKRCKQYFHVSCAQKHGLLYEISNDKKNTIKFCGSCQQHQYVGKKNKNRISYTATLNLGNNTIPNELVRYNNHETYNLSNDTYTQIYNDINTNRLPSNFINTPFLVNPNTNINNNNNNILSRLNSLELIVKYLIIQNFELQNENRKLKNTLDELNVYSNQIKSLFILFIYSMIANIFYSIEKYSSKIKVFNNSKMFGHNHKSDINNVHSDNLDVNDKKCEVPNKISYKNINSNYTVNKVQSDELKFDLILEKIECFLSKNKIQLYNEDDKINSEKSVNKIDISGSLNSYNMCGVVNFAFEAEDFDEISLTKDERINIVSKDHPVWWLGIKSDGSKGLFPANHVSLNTINTHSELKNQTVYCKLRFKHYVQESTIYNIFSRAGNIVEINLNIQKGYALIQFSSNDEAKNAILLQKDKNNSKVYGVINYLFKNVEWAKTKTISGKSNISDNKIGSKFDGCDICNGKIRYGKQKICNSSNCLKGIHYFCFKKYTTLTGMNLFHCKCCLDGLTSINKSTPINNKLTSINKSTLINSNIIKTKMPLDVVNETPENSSNKYFTQIQINTFNQQIKEYNRLVCDYYKKVPLFDERSKCAVSQVKSNENFHQTLWHQKIT